MVLCYIMGIIFHNTSILCQNQYRRLLCKWFKTPNTRLCKMSDKCAICCLKSNQSLCAFCNVKMHTECYIQFVAKGNCIRCPQCTKQRICVIEYTYTWKQVHSRILQRYIYIHHAYNVCRSRWNIFWYFLLRFLAICFFEKNVLDILYIPSFIFHVKQKLLDAITNEHLMKYKVCTHLHTICNKIFNCPPPSYVTNVDIHNLVLSGGV